MKQTFLFLYCGLFLWGLLGCATTRYEEYGPPLDETMVAPPTAASDSLLKKLSDAEARIVQLESELADRTAGLEMANNNLSTQVLALSEQIEGLQRQLQASKEKAAAGKPEKMPAAEPRPADSPTLQARYDSAMQDYFGKRYARAREAFAKVLSQDPQGDLADNAQYWAGECEYALGNFQAALAAFQKVFLFSKTEKDDDAQLKLGLCYFHLGDFNSSMIELKRLVVDYPDSEYLERAEALIQKIRAKADAGP